MIAPSLVRDSRFEGPLLNEIARLGSSEAALDLSGVVGRGIRIETTGISVLRIGHLPIFSRHEAEPPITIYQCAQGEMRGSVALLLSAAGGRVLVDMVRNLTPGSTSTLRTIERSALGEIGRIMSGFFCSSLSKATGLPTRLSPPAVMVGWESTLLEVPLAEPLDPAEEVLAIDVILSDDLRKVKAVVVLAPADPPLAILLEMLARQWRSR